MSTVVVQMGHVPRTSGATGTYREQELARALGTRIDGLLRGAGHRVHLIGADDPIPTSDVFVALHGDGSTNPSVRGASVGYPDPAGATLAHAWKRAHTRAGFPGGWRPDNYTAALRGYYGFRRSSAEHRFLAEHGTMTNPADCDWLFAHIDVVARAHLEAITEVLGPAVARPTPVQEDDMAVIIRTGATPAEHRYAVTDWVQKRGVASIDEVTRLERQGLRIVEVPGADFDVIPVAQ